MISDLRARPSAWSMSKKLRTNTISNLRARPSAEIRMIEIKNIDSFFAILTFQDEPSAGIGVVEALSLPCALAKCPMNPLRGSCVSKRSRCGAVRIYLLLANWSLEVVAWFARLLSESRGRGGFDPCLVRGSFSRQKSQLLSADVVRGRSSGWKIATFKYKCSTRGTVLQLRHNGTFQVDNKYGKYFPKAPRHLRRATCTERCNLRKATSTEHLHRAASARQLGQTKSQVLPLGK